MRSHLYSVLLLSCFLLPACSGGQSGATDTGQAALPDRSPGVGLKSQASACEIFSLKEIRDFFNIAEGTDVKVSESGSAFPACSWEWGEDLVARTIRAGGQSFQIREPAKVMLVVARGVSDGDFDTSTSVYKDAQEVAGIGERARWGVSMSQLTFLKDGDLFHVNVKASSAPEENRALAEGLAGLLLQKS